MKLIEWINGKTKLNKTTFDEFQNNIKSAVVPTGGTTGQVLAKSTNTDNDVEWVTQIGGIAVVDNLTSARTTDALSANQGKVLNKKIMGTVLYNNEAGTTGNITLSDNAENYDYFDFICKRSTHEYTVRVYKPNNKTVSLTTSFTDGTYVYVYTKVLNVSGTQITVVRANIGYFNNTGSYATSDDSNFITKIVGYKIS